MPNSGRPLQDGKAGPNGGPQCSFGDSRLTVAVKPQSSMCSYGHCCVFRECMLLVSAVELVQCGLRVLTSRDDATVSSHYDSMVAEIAGVRDMRGSRWQCSTYIWNPRTHVAPRFCMHVLFHCRRESSRQQFRPKFLRWSSSAGHAMSAVTAKYALCHLCPGKWIRKDLIEKGQTTEEACGAHTDTQLAAYGRQEQAWSDEQLRKLHEATKKAERRP